MKKIKSISTLLLFPALLATTLAPVSGHAMMLIDSIEESATGRSRGGQDSRDMMFLVFPLIPILLLDKAAPTGVRTVTSAALLEQGYTRTEIGQIQTGQSRLGSILLKQKKQLKFVKGETLTSLDKGLRQLDPQVSHSYVRFLAEQSGI